MSRAGLYVLALTLMLTGAGWAQTETAGAGDTTPGMQADISGSDDGSNKHEDFPWDGSRTTPVHNFPMFDEDGQQIVPEFDLAMPMSSRNTCGTCHAYATVSGGWHFNASKGTVPPGRPGEPWVWIDSLTGTQIPLSYRGWKGMWSPKDLGISEWEFTRQFGRHMPGGDVAEPADTTSDPEARWDLSGKAEVNCMACHNGSPVQDHSEWALQMARENFRWAATSAAGLGTVNGMASRMPDSWRVADGPNPDDSEFAVAPQVDYHDNKFDAKHRTVFDIQHKALDKNCLQCHSATQVTSHRWEVDGDVHSMAGIRCADCHRNDLDHNIIRGYEDEAKDRGKAVVAEFSCRGCHIGTDKKLSNGRLGAPIPKHSGIPPVHFEKMECTVCHSGPMPEAFPQRVRTSRANRLGIHGRAKWFTEAPFIVEPVFVRGDNGRIAPHRMMWPAFWAKVEGTDKEDAKLRPLMPEQVRKAGMGILDGEEQIGKVLDALAQDLDAEGTPTLVANGKYLMKSKDGGLIAEDYKATETVAGLTWLRRKGEYVEQLVPEFDTTQVPDSSIETRILRNLEILEQVAKPDPVAYLAGQKMYTRTFEGTLETTDTATTISAPQWVKLVEGKPVPVISEQAAASFAETAGTEFSITEDEVVRMLQQLSSLEKEDVGKFVYVADGRLFTVTSDGKLTNTDHDQAKPVSWPVAHDVRPAAQSLGIKSCAECHSEEAAYLFGDVKPTGPLLTSVASVSPMYRFQQLDGDYHRLFGNSFKVRSTFKSALIIAGVILGMVLMVFSLMGIRKLTQYVSARE